MIFNHEFYKTVHHILWHEIQNFWSIILGFHFISKVGYCKPCLYYNTVLGCLCQFLTGMTMITVTLPNVRGSWCGMVWNYYTCMHTETVYKMHHMLHIKLLYFVKIVYVHNFIHGKSFVLLFWHIFIPSPITDCWMRGGIFQHDMVWKLGLV